MPLLEVRDGTCGTMFAIIQSVRVYNTTKDMVRMFVAILNGDAQMSMKHYNLYGIAG